MKKIRLTIIITLCFLVACIIVLNINAKNEIVYKGFTSNSYELDPSTNFFTQEANKTLIEINDETLYLEENGYKKICENNNLVLYRKDETIGVAVTDKASGYTWYSTYKNIDEVTSVDGLKSKIESGVTVEYYDTNSSKGISYAEISFTKTQKTKADRATAKYTKITNGFKANITFPTIGLKFDLEVTIDKDRLNVNVPFESITEERVGKLNGGKTYQVKSISVFPYFGAENYKINGYSFIPDGSGALIRYTNTPSSTAYIKKVYGQDFGITNPTTSNTHIKNANEVSLPIFGINHGYNQAAFLCEVTSGDGACEIHSYPYLFNNLAINTTFFRINLRDVFIVEMPGNNLSLINENPYPYNYSLSYSFLSGNNANYVGMAQRYAESLGISKTVDEGDISMHLTVLGNDYKRGLFGKQYVAMTTFDDVTNITNELHENNVKRVSFSYLGFNKGGYFNNGAVNAKLSSKLGSTKDFTKMMDTIKNNGDDIDFVINPLLKDSYGFTNQTVKKINLSVFQTSLDSSLKQVAYYLNPSELANSITKNDKKYQKLNIDSLCIDNLNDTFSYRYNNKEYSRTDMIDIIENELTKLTNYHLATSKPNAYLYKYLEKYYDSEYESSKFLYETDSVPFISILLSGHVQMFSPYINYISDYNLMNLRMIEYNIYPSFIITEEEAYNLRYTNFEYLNSTEFNLWKSLIIDTYKTVNDALKYVRGAKICDHETIASGVIKVTYDNNYVIYVNYNTTKYQTSSLEINGCSYLVKGEK